jgi:hypothetical protein
MNALELLTWIGVIPMSIEQPCKKPSTSEMKRWLDQKAVLINGMRPSSKDVVQFPITQLVFFPKSGRRTTVI